MRRQGQATIRKSWVKAMLLPALLAVATLTLAVGMSISLQPQMEQLLSTLRNAVLGDSLYHLKW